MQRRRIATVIALVGLLLSLSVGTVLSVPLLGPNFEIDGNTVQESGSTENDWETVIPGPPGNHIQDPHSKVATDDIFTPSGKFGEPENWTIGTGHNPAQNELTNVYIYAVSPLESDEGDSWMVMGMERTKKQGTFDLDFELNQVPWDGTSGTLVRTPGDVVIGFELKGNPADATQDLLVLILQYDPDDADCTAYPGGSYGAGWCVHFSDNANALGSFGAATMNATGFPAPSWGSLDPKGNARDPVPAFMFAEAAINLTELGIEPGCPGWGSVHAKSRSSLSVTADLKDLAGPISLPVACRIWGHKYEDVDADGDLTDDVNPLSGWTINLYDDGTLVDSTTTSATGFYEFTGLSNGTYRVEEVCEPGWSQSVPGTTDGCGSGVHAGIPVDIEHTDEGPYDFGNWHPGTKSGHKYEDMDADGDISEDSGHPLNGWEIRAYEDADEDGVLSAAEYSADAVTSANTVDGAYTLTLDPGKYIVCEVSQADWTQSAPNNTKCTAGGDLGPGGHAITVESRDVLEGNDFGNWQPGTKSGHKYEDRNRDGSGDVDKPLSGWTINAYADTNGNGVLDTGEDAAVAATDDTGALGAYELTLNPGDYIVCEELESNWLQQYPDNTKCQAGTGLAAGGHAITVYSRSDLTGNDFGNYQQADLEVSKVGKISYTIEVKNNGPSTALNVDLDDTLPGDLTWVENPDKTECTITGGTILHCDIPSLAASASFSVTVEANITTSCEVPLLGNDASANSDIYDPNTADNSDDADICPIE